jgi:hypothetical protein
MAHPVRVVFGRVRSSHGSIHELLNIRLIVIEVRWARSHRNRRVGMDNVLSAQDIPPGPNKRAADEGAPADALLPGRDLFEIARYLVPMDALLAQGCLQAAGIPAVLADEQLVQTNLLWAPAIGGVRILVPQEYIQQAEAALQALQRGEFALDDDADVGAPD